MAISCLYESHGVKLAVQHTGPAQTVCLLALGSASLVLLVSGTYNPFIYFRF